LGIVVQTSALFAVWMFPRRSHTVPPLGYWFSTHHRDSGSRACNHLRVDNVVGAARAGKAVEPAVARARRSQTGSRRTVSFCAASDLQRHSWNDRGRWTRMVDLLQRPSLAMMPSRIRLNATSATEQKIPLARIYQAIASFLNLPSKTSFPTRKE